MTKRLVRGLRWWIATLLFFVTVINLLDRLTISVLAPVIIAQLGLSNTDFATINIAFQAAYASSQGLSGWLFDRIGTRRGFSFAVLLWSLAAMAHAFVRGIASLSFVRFLLGLCEGGNWPGSAKTVAEWFPIRERALGISIVNAASTVGPIIASPLVIWLQLRFGWQTAFLATGSLGLLWLVPWLLFYRAPEKHPSITAEELALIQRDRTPATLGAEGKGGDAERKLRYLELLRYRQVWAILLARFFADPVWWLYITWLPLYLYKVRGFSLAQIGLFAWVPYVAAGAGSIFGGWLSGFFIAKGWTVNSARKTVMVVGVLLMGGGVWVSAAQNPFAALALIAMVLFGFQSWIGNVQTMPSDFFPQSAVASVAGLGGFGAGVGAMLFTYATGFVVDTFRSYTPILITAGLLPVLATLILFLLGGPIHRVRFVPAQDFGI